MESIFSKIDHGDRISKDEAYDLLINADTMKLGEYANIVKTKLHPENRISFVVDRNINYTNICVSKCLFCAFYCDKDSGDGYIISFDKLNEKIEETLELGGTQILLQGGIHPDLGIDYYESLLKYIKENFEIHIHGFSPPEIVFLSEKEGLTIKQTITRLTDAGLNSIPGGGAEILVNEIRAKVSPGKCDADQWIETMKVAHSLGLKSSATMMFGHIEKPEHIIEHLYRIRKLQDETKGFTAFIPWSFQPDNTKINVEKTTPVDYLRILAVSRIFLDNIDNIQASWVTQGDKIAQMALAFGANDMGSTMIEENVVAAAGVNFLLSKKEIIRLIQNTGADAVQRDCYYNILKEF
ncbi:MAG: dehypoxanthine futalosine cyclase [Desulfobacterales bacterium]|nr:dehypoxanthine futalosine cyclase [Desulfobacterales bacterium]